MGTLVGEGGQVEMEATVAQRRLGFYYGWLMLPVTIVAVIVTAPGQTFGLAAFNESFRTSLGLTHSQLSGAYMLGTLLAALPLSYLGRLMDRHGLRRTATGAVLLLGLACGVAAMADGLVTLFAAFFLLRLLGPGTMSLVSSNTLAFWFHRRLGTLEGIRNLGLAGAIAVIPGLNLWLIDRVGWRPALTFLGLGVYVLMLPLLAFVFRNRPEEVGQCIDGRPPDGPLMEAAPPLGSLACGWTFAQTVRSYSFWFVLFLNALWGMIGTAVTFNIVPIFQARGWSEGDAARLLSVSAISMAVTNLAGGMLADRVPLHRLLALSAACMTGLTWGLRTLSSPGVALSCGIAMGMAQGLSTGITAVLCVRYFGRSHLGQIRGVISTATVAAASVGPFLVGLARDLTGGYADVLTAFAGLAIVGFVASIFAGAPRRVFQERT